MPFIGANSFARQFNWYEAFSEEQVSHPCMPALELVPEVTAFAELITKMEQETDGLILDELNNPGGQSYYLDALVSLLVTKPVPTAMFRMVVNSI